MNKKFSLNGKRFSLLFRRDLLQQIKGLSLVTGAVALGLFLIALLIAYDDPHDAVTFHINTFPNVLLIGGLLFTSIIFNELNSPVSRHFYLALPASNFEKFLSKWLLTSVFFIVFSIVAYVIFSWFANRVIWWWTHVRLQSFSPLEPASLRSIQFYLVVQTIFLLGAIGFRKFSLAKTLIALLGLAFILGILLFLVVRILFADYFDGWEFVEPGPEFIKIPALETFFTKTYTAITQVAFWGVLGPLMLLATYFKLREKEV